MIEATPSIAVSYTLSQATLSNVIRVQTYFYLLYNFPSVCHSDKKALQCWLLSKSLIEILHISKNLVWMSEPFLKQNVLLLLFWVVQFKTNAKWAEADWEDRQANSSRVYKGTSCCQLLVYYLTRWLMLLPYDKVPACICTL